VKRRLTEEEIRAFDAIYRLTASDRGYCLDTFFVESMAYDAGLAYSTLLRRLPSLPWVVRLDYGKYGSCVSSMQAYGSSLRGENDARHRDHTHTQERDPLGRFAPGNTEKWSTGVSGLSPLKKVG
jgi:hypothetical protein